MASKRVTPKQAPDEERLDGGYIIMLTALLIVPLLAFTGFAVDLGAWYARSAKIQRASEAAALAGVTYMPDFNTAEQVALDVAAANGFPEGGDIAIEVEAVGDSLNALKVTIDDGNVDQYFTKIFTPNVTIERAAVAEYVSPIRMGSPNNYLGNDPVSGNIPYHWLVTFGPESPKGEGDRFHTLGCSGANIGCSGSSNAEYATDGYYFTVPVVGTPPGQDLHFQAYDPFFYDHANNCNTTGSDSGGQRSASYLPTAATVANPAGFYATNFPYTVGNANLQQRFARGNTTWCTGDSNGTGTEPNTTFIVREPSTDPFDPTTGDIVCAVQYGPINVANAADFQDKLTPTSAQGTDTNAFDATVLADTTGTAGTNETLTFERGWRRWIDLCSVSGASVQEGEYIIQVRTNVSTDPEVADTTTGRGNNRYSLRTGWATGSTDVLGSTAVTRTAGAASVSLGALSRLPVFVNTASTTTEFFMARVTPEYKGKRLVLDIYDTTDGGAINRLELVPTSDATYDPGGGSTTLTEWPDCEFFRVNGPVSNPTRVDISGGGAGGMARVGGTTCAMSATSGSGNGYAIRIEIDIPVTYDCNDADPFGCWVKMEIDYGSAPQDTTTWSASIDGDPVRLTG